MKCLITEKVESKIQTRLLDRETPKCLENSILFKVEHSSINYKDALAVTGKGSILKSFPLIPGIDAAGTVLESRSGLFKSGDKVLVTGCGLGETHDGGYAEYVHEHESRVVKLPENISTRSAMIIGTAGFTALLAIERMILNGQRKEQGPIVVTGASGGVGQFSVKLLAAKGFEVIAISSKPEATPRLKELGATSIRHPKELPDASKALGSAQWAGAIDNLGGEILQSLIAHCDLWGNISSIGLASSHKLNTTVMPFILRGVSLLGASSNNTPSPLRIKIWNEFSKLIPQLDIESFVTAECSLNQVIQRSEEMLNSKTSGRTLVNI